MAIRVECESCGAPFEVPDRHAGKRGKCPKCGEPIRVGPAPPASDPETASMPVLGDEPDPASGSRVTPLAVALGSGAAVLGAVAWAGIAYQTGYEFGWTAWAIGGAVGFVAVKQGGRGTAMGVVAALLTVASIFGGKLGTYHLALEREFDSIARTDITREDYRESEKDAEDFAALPSRSNEALREYMATHGYTEAAGAAAITDDEVTSFRLYDIPYLEAFAAESPTYEAWREHEIAGFREMIGQEVSFTSAVFEDATPTDGIFVMLGIATAFGLCTRASRDGARRRSRGRAAAG